MKQIRILRASDGVVLFTCQANTMRQAVEQAVEAGVSLAGAQLTGQDLRGIKARRGDFTGAAMDGMLADAGDFTNAGMDSITATNASATFAKFVGEDVKMNMRSANWTNAALDSSIFQNIAMGSSTFTGTSKENIVADLAAADDLDL
jgi:uncharacterized protein YjbI with pentapeptide repeats